LLLGNFKESAVLFQYVGRVWYPQLTPETQPRLEGRFLPGSARLLAEHSGAGGAVISWLDSLWFLSCTPPACLPALMSILPTGGFLWSVVGAG